MARALDDDVVSTSEADELEDDDQQLGTAAETPDSEDETELDPTETAPAREEGVEPTDSRDRAQPGTLPAHELLLLEGPAAREVNLLQLQVSCASLLVIGSPWFILSAMLQEGSAIIHPVMLQTGELLKEIRFDYNEPRIQQALEKLKAVLAKIPEQEAEPSIAAGFLDGLNLRAKACPN